MITTFRDLHRPGAPFILANAWDAGSAKMLAALGARAIATSSAAHAFTLGRGDGGQVSRDEALAHAADLIAATPLPVSGDFENGFGDAPEDCAETVRLSAEVGLAGISIEDIAHPTGRAYDRDFAIERIRAAASAARALPVDLVLCARADGVMEGAYDVDEAIARCLAFEEVGADCVYMPMPPGLEDLRKLISAVRVPVNVLVAGRFSQTPVAEYAAIGAARLSLGSALARVTHAVIDRIGRSMFEDGDFSGFADAASGAAIDGLLARGSRTEER